MKKGSRRQKDAHTVSQMVTERPKRQQKRMITAELIELIGQMIHSVLPYNATKS